MFASNEQSFLTAIIADPDDVTLRLIYADWLEDHDQPERANLVRHTDLNCTLDNIHFEYNRGVIARCVYRPEWVSMESSDGMPSWAMEILKSLVPNPLEGYRCGINFRGGLVYQMRCPSKWFYTSGMSLCKTNPIREIVFTDQDARFFIPKGKTFSAERDFVPQKSIRFSEDY